MTEKLDFGSSFLYRITDGPYSAEIIPCGAALRSLRVPDREGRSTDVVLGYDTPGEYAAQDACLGAIVGRYANRISNASFSLNGKIISLFPNEGKNTLHGGRRGFHQTDWDLTADESSVTCTLLSPDGDEGFPGNLRVTVTYTLSGGALSIRYRALSDADTALNLTNHAYFNLAGQDKGTVEDHLISIAAHRFTPADGGNIPTGELREVSGTPWDLTVPTLLGERLQAPELVPSRGFDQNFVLDGAASAATLYCPRSGIRMTMDTDREGVQLYTAGWLTPRRGKEGAAYGPTSGLCLETQHFPDAVNKPHFPSPFLRGGEVFQSTTVFRFSLSDQ